MKLFLTFFLFLFSLIAQTQEINIVPRPASVKKTPGNFLLSKATVITAVDEEDRKTASLLNDYLRQTHGLQLDIDRQEGKNYIRLVTRKYIKAPDKDSYTLTVKKDGITIEGDTYAGTFYGVQSLVQLLSPGSREASYPIPLVQIADTPRFNYRGMHLDVARHYFPLSFVKRYIDYLAMHKLNYFHWHLTDDQGWRIQIDAYPKLTEVGAWRNGTIIGRYPGVGNDNQRYGGFYTKDEVKEVVRYAAERYITVIPEIEMPGHASAAIAAYPWLSCFPDKETNIPSHPSLASQAMKGKKVQETWGVFEDVFCAGNDSVFRFLEAVLDEVIPLFPSAYVHAGGDECPKTHWKQCPRCQARIKSEGLKDEHELQSYFVQRMEKYLNSKGKILIGWDEILEGGLAPNAVVMSWRGEAGGIAAAQQKHKVIMTPQRPVYFDHTQTKNEDSVVIGGFNPIEAVYTYDPVPAALSAEAAKYIIGGQANLWAEYIRYPSKVEYMVFPRMGALSEILWTPAQLKSWSDFERRLPLLMKRYASWGANYSKAYFDLQTSILPAKNNKGLIWKIGSKAGGDDDAIVGMQQIRYQKDTEVSDTFAITDINDPNKIIEYKIVKKLKLAGSLDTVTSYGRDALTMVVTETSTNSVWPLIEGRKGKTLVQSFEFNKATGKKVIISKKPNEKYPGQPGAFSLVNGVYSPKGLSYPDWLGWIGDDMEAVIDLQKIEMIDSVRMHTLDQNGSWVYLPRSVEVFVSKDGKRYESAGSSSEFKNDVLTMGWITVKFPKLQARFVKVVAKNYGTIPVGKPGGGTKAWLFADEIQAF